MISPWTIEEDARRWNEETAAGIREIRRVYTRSGLYRNDGSTDPLWSVDWYAHGVEVASDGVHLVRLGPWPGLGGDRGGPLGAALGTEGVSFFANGQLLRTYSIGELVDSPNSLPRSVSHFTWQKDGRLDDRGSQYTLTTLDGNRFVFDLRTGEVVSQSRQTGPVNWFWCAVIGVVATGVIAWIARRRKPQVAVP